MDLLAAGYGSDSENSDDVEVQNGVGGRGPQEHSLRPNTTVSEAESDDDSAASSDESVDSATLRAAEAAARLRDYGERAVTSGRQPQQQRPKALLPSALDALNQVDRPPDFLDPEAIRPLASSAMHALSDEAAALLAGGGGPGGGRARQQKGKDFDISVLAPPLKGQRPKQGPDKRDAPAGAVIEGKAKRYKAEEGPEATQQYTAAQIAMMGGKVAVGGGAAGGDFAPKAPRAPSKPMEVSEFLNKGVGAAQLPRKGADRKDKEKDKRMKGQSTHAHWKSEAEMVLRQQFDS